MISRCSSISTGSGRYGFAAASPGTRIDPRPGFRVSCYVQRCKAFSGQRIERTAPRLAWQAPSALGRCEGVVAPMTEITHTAVEHEFVEYGRRRCGPDCLLSMQECRCGLQRRLRILEGQVRMVEVKTPGGYGWQDVRDLLAVALPYALCPGCTGPNCERCRGLGILERIPPHIASGKR